MTDVTITLSLADAQRIERAINQMLVVKRAIHKGTEEWGSDKQDERARLAFEIRQHQRILKTVTDAIYAVLEPET